MAKEQVDRAEPPPPPPSVGNDNNKSQGFAENLGCLAFWVERCVVALVVIWLYWFPPNDWGSIFFTAVSSLIFSNSLYLISLFSSLLQMAANRYDGNTTEVAVIGSVTLVITTCVAVIETLSYGSLIAGVVSAIRVGVAVLGAALVPEEERKKQIDKKDKKNTGQQEAKLDFSSKESKEEVQAKEDEMNDKIDEELTGQQKAKLNVSLKDSKEEVRSSCCCCTSEEIQSLEAKYHAKYENLLQKYFDKCHGWEEERSQLMKELGSAKASSEIYRELLHGSDDF